MEDYPFISVVVPVLNRENDIGRCVESLLKLNYPSYEIIVIDNGSTDKTREIVLQYPVKLLTEEKKGAYRARMTGVRAAQGDIIAFTDSDCVVDKDWLKNLARNYTHEKVGGAGGDLLPYEPSNLIEEFLSFGSLRIFHSSETTVMQRESNQFLSGALGSANMSYRKNVLDEVGGFCADFTVFCGDYALCWQVQNAGYDVIYEPKAVVYHKLRSSLFQLIKQLFCFGKCQPQLLKKQPGRFSYFKIKTYIFPAYEFKCKLPIQMLVTFDFCSLLIVGLILVFVSRFFLYLSIVIFLAVLLGAFRKSYRVVRKTKRLKWFILYLFLPLIQNYALMAGRIIGGIRYRVIAI